MSKHRFIRNVQTGNGGPATSWGNNSPAYGGDGGDFKVGPSPYPGNLHVSNVSTGDGGRATSYGNNSPAVGGDGGDFIVR